tara:strand:- start:2658 stop:3506 length:849 start_codon:yes stop_codon:yes gene_type:complete
MQASRDDFIIAIRSAFLKKENKQKFSLLALIFLTFIILVSEKLNFKLIEYLKISLREVAYRSTFIVSVPENFVKKSYIATRNHFKVYEENKILKEQLSFELSKNYNSEYILEENKRLKSTIDETTFLTSEIIGKVLIDKKSPFLRSVIINRGSKDGVELGMAVMDKSFLIGKVVEVSFTTSRVLLLSDLNSKVPVDIMPNNIQSILSGTGTNNGVIQYIRQQELIEKDAVVFTSGAGGLFRSGIPIGKIDKDPTSLKVVVNFFSDFSQLRYVKIISFKEETE